MKTVITRLIHAIQFKSIAKLRSELEAAGFPKDLLIGVEKVH
jgi:hypothetical protein